MESHQASNSQSLYLLSIKNFALFVFPFGFPILNVISACGRKKALFLSSILRRKLFGFWMAYEDLYSVECFGEEIIQIEAPNSISHQIP